MSKVVVTLAERLAQLRVIPPEKIPSTLKYDISLPKFQEIRFQSARAAKELGPIFAFYRKYIAALRLNNPNLRIVRDVTETGPLIARVLIIKKQNEQPLQIQTNKMKTTDELKNKILQLHEQA